MAVNTASFESRFSRYAHLLASQCNRRQIGLVEAVIHIQTERAAKAAAKSEKRQHDTSVMANVLKGYFACSGDLPAAVAAPPVVPPANSSGSSSSSSSSSSASSNPSSSTPLLADEPLPRSPSSRRWAALRATPSSRRWRLGCHWNRKRVWWRWEYRVHNVADGPQAVRDSLVQADRRPWSKTEVCDRFLTLAEACMMTYNDEDYIL